MEQRRIGTPGLIARAATSALACVWIAVCVPASRAQAFADGVQAGAQTPLPLPAPQRTPCPKPDDPIAIQSVQISENPIVAGTSVSGVVLATCNVAAVTAQVGTYRIGVPKTSPGVFRTTVAVPHFVWPGRFSLVVTAIRTDGAKVAKIIPIVVRW